MQLPSTRREIEELVVSKLAEYFKQAKTEVDLDADLRSECGASEDDVDQLLLWCYEAYGVDITNTETEQIETGDDLVVQLNCHRLEGREQ